MTKCCYCTLERLKQEAKAAGLEIRLLPAVSKVGSRPYAMIAAYMVVANPERVVGDPLPFTGQAPKSYGEPIAEFGELSDHCVC